MERCDPKQLSNATLELRKKLLECLADEEPRSLLWYVAQRALMHLDSTFDAVFEYEVLKSKMGGKR